MNMDMRVSFMGIIAQCTHEKELALKFEEPPTLRRLLEDLERRYGEEFGGWVFRNAKPPRRLQMCARIFVNGNAVEDDALERAIPARAGDASAAVLVYILPAACGG